MDDGEPALYCAAAGAERDDRSSGQPNHISRVVGVMVRWHKRRAVVVAMRLQIVLMLLAIVALAFLASFNYKFSADSPQIVAYTAIGCALASLAGFLLVRNVESFPGVEQFFYIVPAFCGSYGSFLAVLILARIPYSRLLLTGSFAASILIFFAVYLFVRRHSRLDIGVVAAGDYSRLLETPGARWRVLATPDAYVDDLDAVSVDLLSDLPDEWEHQLASFALRGLPVYHSKHLRESLTGTVEIEQLSENNFGTLTPLRAYMTVKHIGDWLAALLVVVVTSPLLLALAIAIRLDSPGPAIFRQARIGYQGRAFTMLKFRSMTTDGASRDKAGARVAAITQDDDQRVTRIGRFLRRTRLDEIPQLFNVLRGEMSWIGPRPEAEVLSRWYENEIPFYHYRHIVRPGITGWAQVHQGHVADVKQVREKLNFDFYYIKNFSLWVDVIVIGRTIRTMMTGFGSK